MSQENEQQYTEHYLRHACIIDTPKEQHTSMRMDYLHAAERADNLMECLNLMQLIKMEYSKFKSGEYKDDEYKQQLEKAYEIVAKKFHGDNEEYQRDIQAKVTRCADKASIPSSPVQEPHIELIEHKPYIIDSDGKDNNEDN